MRIRLHEIEFGSNDVSESRSFYQTVLSLQAKINQEELVVFDSGNSHLDFNVSSHFSKGIVAVSFLSDDVSEIEKRLKEAGISYEGPFSSHLGMTCIQFKDPNGYIIKINTPGPQSPAFLKV